MRHYKVPFHLISFLLTPLPAKTANLQRSLTNICLESMYKPHHVFSSSSNENLCFSLGRYEVGSEKVLQFDGFVMLFAGEEISKRDLSNRLGKC